MKYVLLEKLPNLFFVFLNQLVIASFEHCAHFGSSFFVRELFFESVIHTVCENLGEEPEFWVLPQDSFKLVQGAKFGLSIWCRGQNLDPNRSVVSWCCDSRCCRLSSLCLRRSVLNQTASSDRSNITGGALGTGALAVATLLIASINHAGGLNALLGLGSCWVGICQPSLGGTYLLSLWSLAFALSTRSRFLGSATISRSVGSPSGVRSSSLELTTTSRASRPIMLSFSVLTGLSANVAFSPGSVGLVVYFLALPGFDVC
jgi:hypothetical protein